MYKCSSNTEVAYSFHTLPCTLQSDPNVLYSQLHFNLKILIDGVRATHPVSNYTEYTIGYSQAKYEYFDFSQTHSMISKIIIPKHIMNHLIHM